MVSRTDFRVPIIIPFMSQDDDDSSADPTCWNNNNNNKRTQIIILHLVVSIVKSNTIMPKPKASKAGDTKAKAKPKAKSKGGASKKGGAAAPGKAKVRYVLFDVVTPLRILISFLPLNLLVLLSCFLDTCVTFL